MSGPRQRLGILAIATAVTAQQEPAQVFNPAIDISSCEAPSCAPRNGSICSTEDLPGPTVGVGITAEVVNASSTKLSLTLIDGLSENGFTGIGSNAYEFSDQQLFVGVDPSLSEDDYPSGCALMMQYQGQTFPLEAFPDDDLRSESSQNTTSCDGVVNVFCQSAIMEMIRSFDASNATDDRCQLLTQYVSSKLQENSGTCGGEGTWIANFFNVTGGDLPSGSTETASNDRLGDEECRPVLPQSYRMYKIVEMRSFTFAEAPDSGSDFYADLFGGRAGFTPVVTVVFPEDSAQDRGVQFSCMKTFQPDGEPREDPYTSGACGRMRNGVMMTASSLALGLIVWILR